MAADLRGTKPAPNGIDTPGQCTRELGQLGGSAANKLNCLKNKLRTSYGGIELLVLARMGCLYCRLAIELPTQTRQLGAAHYGSAQGAAQDDGGVARPC